MHPRLSLPRHRPYLHAFTLRNTLETDPERLAKIWNYRGYGQSQPMRAWVLRHFRSETVTRAKWHCFGRDYSHIHTRLYTLFYPCTHVRIREYFYAQTIASEWIQILLFELGRTNKAEAVSTVQPLFGECTRNRGDHCSDYGMDGCDECQCFGMG